MTKVTGYGKSLSPTIREPAPGRLAFWCPGCDHVHVVSVAPSPNPWGYNGDPRAPTFEPSVLHNVGGGHPGLPICHSYVRLGRIEFLADSTHALAGQTVDLPRFDR